MIALPIAGIIPFSATDWPGKLTATVFTQGCPWRCRYCHNPSLQDIRPVRPREEHAAVSFSEVIRLLRSRRGLLDGLVFSGGEPTLHRTLGDAIAAVHDCGFPCGMHTCGYAPARVEALLRSERTRPEWIGFDIKALPEHVVEVTGASPRSARASWECLTLLRHARDSYGIAVEVRTTSWPGGIVEAHLDELRQRVADAGFDVVVHEARNVDKQGFYCDDGADVGHREA